MQVLQDLFYVLLHVLFYLWSILNISGSFGYVLTDGRAGLSSLYSKHGVLQWEARQNDDDADNDNDDFDDNDQGRLSLSTNSDKCAMVIFFWGGGIN